MTKEAKGAENKAPQTAGNPPAEAKGAENKAPKKASTQSKPKTEKFDVKSVPSNFSEKVKETETDHTLIIGHKSSGYYKLIKRNLKSGAETTLYAENPTSLEKFKETCKAKKLY